MNLECIGLYKRGDLLAYGTAEQQRTTPNAPLLSIQRRGKQYAIYYNRVFIQSVSIKDLTEELIIDLLYNKRYQPAVLYKRESKISKLLNG